MTGLGVKVIFGHYPQEGVVEDDAGLGRDSSCDHVGHNVLLYPLVHDSRLLAHKVCDRPAHIENRHGLCVHRGNHYVNLGVALTVPALPTAAVAILVPERSPL